jgi:hypothetical protein
MTDIDSQTDVHAAQQYNISGLFVQQSVLDTAVCRQPGWFATCTHILPPFDSNPRAIYLICKALFSYTLNSKFLHSLYQIESLDVCIEH